MATPRDETMLSVTDIAERLKIHPETVRRLVRAGKLKGHRIARQVRVTEADLAAFLATGATDEPEAAAPMIGLPRPTRGAAVHQVVIELGDHEFACLRTLADRQGADSPAAAATDLVLRGLRAEWLAEQADL